MAIFSLANKTTVITGGGSGIGKEIAIAFVRQGASVHIIENDAKAGDQAVLDLKQMGLNIKTHRADVSQYDEIHPLVNSIAKNGSIDILINNAGIAHIGTAESTD